MPLELRVSKKINLDSETNEDGYYTNTTSDQVRSNKDNLQQWRQHTINENYILNDLKQSGLSVDKITQFSLRPPELRSTIDMVGNYYRWFYILMEKKVESVDMDTHITINIRESFLIDGLQRQVKLREKALIELMKWCDTLEDEDNIEQDDNGQQEMITLFRDINNIVNIDVEEVNDDDRIFLKHIRDNLLWNETDDHLPIPVYSLLTPTMSLQFINHIMLSFGRFSTEIDLSLHGTIKEKFRQAKLIGTNDDEESLQRYANEICVRYIKEQVRYYPNSMNAIQSFIVEAGRLFESVIVKDEIPSSDLPPVQYSILLRSMKDEAVQNRQRLLSRFIDAILLEMGEELIQQYEIPTKEELLDTSLEHPIAWDPISCMSKSAIQSDESFLEQKMAIQTCKDAIDSYCNIMNQTTLTKSVIIRGHPGAGKTFCMLYMALYSISKGLYSTGAAKMCHRSLQMGTQHWHLILCLLGNEDNVRNPYRRAELAVARIRRRPISEDFIKSLHVIFADELGQLSAEEITIYDYILRQVRSSNLFMGGILMIGTLDHLQIQPIKGRPFLLAHSVIPCIKMISLIHSVRASGDEFVELQSIIRKDYNEFESNPNLEQRFRDICSDIFTFVDCWNDERITSQTYRLFSKKHPGREALDMFQSRLIQNYINSPLDLRKRVAIDLQKSKISHDWRPADVETSRQLDKKCKENHTLLFEVGLVYSCTYNDGPKSNTQKAILFDLPSQDVLNVFGPIKMLLAPPGCKEVKYIDGATKQSYFEKGFIESSINCQPREKIVNLPNHMQAQRKQYGIQHNVSGTIHSAMGDTLPSLATSLSTTDSNYSMWDKGQLLVILSRTKLAKDTIFVGNKENTLDALVSLLKTRTQWTQYMEEILKIVTINHNYDNDNNEQIEYNERGLNQQFFPYRICDISIPTDTSGYVYMLISIRKNDFVYIGKTKDLNERLRAHNSGHGSQTSQPLHLRPYSFYAYICGFNGNEGMMYYIEQKWKDNVARMISHGINEPRIWAQRGGNDLLNLDLSNYGIDDTRSELRLILLFRD